MPYSLRTRRESTKSAEGSPAKQRKTSTAKSPKSPKAKSPKAPKSPSSKVTKKSPAAKKSTTTTAAATKSSTSPSKLQKISLQKTLKLADTLKKAVVTELQTLGKTNPALAKSRVAQKSVKQAVNAQIAQKGVLNEIKKLGKNPNHRVAKRSVKKGLLKVVTPKVIRKATNAKVNTEKLRKAVVSELKRVNDTGKVADVATKVHVNEQKKLLNAEVSGIAFLHSF